MTQGKKPATSEQALAQRLERGEILFYPACPFALPDGDDRRFLFEQQLASRVHKNIGYDPCTGKTTGFLRHSSVQSERLRRLLGTFADSVTAWVSRLLPRYAASWQLDRVSFRPEQESTRKLRLTARNDLLHVDAFPSRPTNGARILRVFANINQTEPRIWITSHPFKELLARYGRQAGLPTTEKLGSMQQLREMVLKIFRPDRQSRSVYDSFMLRFHNFLKANQQFQNDSPRRWVFPPGSAWLVMTDTASHAVLSGRYALEHSYFISPESQALPEESPAALLQQACGVRVLRKAG